MAEPIYVYDAQNDVDDDICPRCGATWINDGDDAHFYCINCDVKCPVCGGAGTLWDNNAKDDYSCDFCEGNGYVDKDDAPAAYDNTDPRGEPPNSCDDIPF